jgi:hypothetical protein
MQPCDTFGKLLPTTGNLKRARVTGMVDFSMAAHVHRLLLLLYRYIVLVRIETPVPVSLTTPEATGSNLGSRHG